MLEPLKTVKYQKRMNILLSKYSSAIKSTNKHQVDWKCTLDNIVGQCDRDEEKFFNLCVYCADYPGWILYCSPKENGHLIVFGGGWGKQLEEAGHFFKKITVIESLAENRQYLKKRFSNSTNCSYQFLSEVEFDKEITTYTPDAIDTVLIRGDFLNGIAHEKLKTYLLKCKPFIKTNGEILIETWGLLKNWKKKIFNGPARKQWHHFLENTLGLDIQSYQLIGAHLYSNGYYENKAGRDAHRKRASNSISLLSKYGRYILSELIYRTPKIMPIDHLIVGRQNSSAKSVINLINELYPPRFTKQLNRSPSIRVAGRGITMLPLELKKDRICRIPISATGRYRCSKNHTILNFIKESLPQRIGQYLPASEKSVLYGFELYAEEKLPGKPGPATLSRPCFDESLCWLADFQRATYKVIKSPAEDGAEAILTRVDQLVQLSESIISHYGNASHVTAWELVKPHVLSIPWGTGIALCASHGDFNPTNLLFSNDTLSGVIDWETGVSLSFPGRDLYWFILYNKIGKNKASTVSEYKETILNRSLYETAPAYVNQVNHEILTTVQHPWSRIIYPLEKLHSIWDGFDLTGVVADGRIWLDYLLILDDHIKLSKETRIRQLL